MTVRRFYVSRSPSVDRKVLFVGRLQGPEDPPCSRLAIRDLEGVGAKGL